jgi:dihydroxyacetone kinase-like predicted kinase
LAAALALAPQQSVEHNARILDEAVARLQTGAVAPAARDDALGRFVQGDAVGFVSDEVAAWGDAAHALVEVASRLAGGAELISVLAGKQAPLGLSAVADLLQDQIGDAELELREGGQEAYWWLLAAE